MVTKKTTAKTQADSWIPELNIGEDYDKRYLDAVIHYDQLGKFADFFGREQPIHRHVQSLKIHFIDRGEIHFHIDDKLYHVQGPALFLTPPTVPHSFGISEDAAGHVLTIRQSLIWQLMKRTAQSEPEIKLDSGICLSPGGLKSTQLNQWKLMTELLQHISQEWYENCPARSVALENFVNLLLIQISCLSPQRARSSAVNNEELRLFHQFSQQIELYFREHWSVPKYASTIGVSESRLNQICQRIANVSPKKLVRERLLQESDTSLFSKLNGGVRRWGFSRHSLPFAVTLKMTLR
ncbi:4-hydroxyphenylacetate catabolism regulatory protein HpaA [Pseudomaricurvus alcaniphilus]|uniref:AraC family ligand binding domain-containing protein n=1 Tax=Pseudomaricurvus alcaniphilus TaxID=1166482 RepID=UPI00140A2E21|nr:AraC family ligand binding domain-containing protein [Pseudomaricurvus alcaniphilus]NHN40002.1 4-hydroxyphenylacetate catabolism regulatory protein HpaA [Pseudomaricurvus alcaniphilus]